MNERTYSFEARPLLEEKPKGMGAKSIQVLAGAGIVTVGDLLACLPRAYTDYTSSQPIATAPLKEPVQIRGRVLSTKASISARKRMPLYEILIDDGSGTMRVIWFNQSWIKEQVNKGQEIALYGSIRFDALGRCMNNPKYKPLHGQESGDKLEIIYRTFGNITSEKIRKWILALLEGMPEEETLSRHLIEHHHLISRKAAFQQLHNPANKEVVKDILAGQSPAQKRLIFEEFLAFQLRLAGLAEKARSADFPHIQTTPTHLQHYIDALPFQLTADQDKVIRDLHDQFAKNMRVHALIQGDVGCGKTVVGLAAAAFAAKAGYQTALLCPTTILATQHAKTAHELLSTIGIRVAHLSSQVSKEEQRQILADLEMGHVDVVIGTHRLIQKDVAFKNLGVVMIDEQHRFGVDQRAVLLKKGNAPHYLAFSATPIPRSLALTLYGEFQVFQIRTRPAGRKPIETILIKAHRRMEVVDFVRFRLDRGESVFWVFPMIEGDEEDLEKASRSAILMYEELSQQLPDVGLVHGRLKKEELSATMEAFRQGDIKVLVATAVIEVGVDVPNATIMVIEGADHFGLSQLHQLRGRIGRGQAEGFCFLIATEEIGEVGKKRLTKLRQSHDGFEIAQFDLNLRGAGDLLGKAQSGFKGFQFGDPWQHRELMEAARKAVTMRAET